MTGRKKTVKKLLTMVGIGLVGLVLQGATNDVAKVKESDIAAKKAKDRALIEALLKKQDLKYTIDDEREMLKLGFELGDNRSQRIWIDSEILEVDGFWLVQICSVSYRGILTKPMMLDLLSDRYEIGHWSVVKSDKGHDVLFTAEVPTYLSPKDFEICCRLVAEAADLLERKWSDSDSL